MTETKRVALTSIDVHKSKKEKKVIKSFRFSLTLTESNEKSCPIFNYRELVESATEKEQPVINGLDLFDDQNIHNLEIQRLARQYEAKYGGAVSSKKKKKKYKGDWADVGAGYDENDSFIDNTDAYDEIVPEDISPEHGGFYINSGSLEFKQQDVSESSDNKLVQKSRKRLIDSDDSDEENIDKNKNTPVEKKQKIENDIDRTSKKSENDVNVIAVKKKLQIAPDTTVIKKKTVKDLLKEKRDDTDLSNDELKQKSKEYQLSNNNNTEQNKTALSSTSINDIIESVIQCAGQNPSNYDESSKDSSTSGSSVFQSTENSTYSGSSDEDDIHTNNGNNDNDVDKKNCTVINKLPDNLSEEIIQLINTMQNTTKNSEGKSKFFTENVNNMLLRLHDLCRLLKSTSRSQIYGYLAAFAKCKRDTIVRRTKKLVLNKEKKELQDSLSRLKECIDRSMPIIIENYRKECSRINGKKLTQDGSRFPKRKFSWSEQTRKYLGDIIASKRKCYNIERCKEPFHQYLENFYRLKMVSLWPDGWMSSAYLIRESVAFLSNEEKPPKYQFGTNNVVSTINKVNKPPEGVIKSKLPAKATSESTNMPNKLSVVSSTSLSIKPISVNDTVNIVKNNNSKISGSGITIEPFPSKVIIEPKQKVLSPTPTDLSTTYTSTKSIDNSKMQSKSVSPVPFVDKNKDSNKSKPESSVITVRKLSDLVSNAIESTPSSNAAAVVRIEAESKKEDSDVEIIEIKDDDSPPHTDKAALALSQPKQLDIETKIKHKHKKKSKSHHLRKEQSDILSKVLKDKQMELKEHKSAKSGYLTSENSLLTKLITETLSNSSVSITRKTNNSTEQDDNKVISDPDDVLQVMKDLRELQEMTGSNNKDNNGDMSHSNSPVSVIAVNSSNRQSPLKNHYSVSAPCKSLGGSSDAMGFQDAFQKHLFQDSIDCKNSASNSFSTSSQGKIQINSNSIDIIPLFRSSNSTTIVPISTKYSQNLTINASTSITPIASSTTQQTGAAVKKDVMLFPNFLYEYHLNKKSGPAQKSSPD